MTARALACGAIVGLVEAARALAFLPHVTMTDGALLTLLSTLVHGVVAASLAWTLRPFVGARLARGGASSAASGERLRLAAASGVALGMLVATLRLRALAGFAQMTLLAFASGPLLEGAVAGLVAAACLARLSARWIRSAWWAAAALGLAAAATLSGREVLGERLAAPYVGRPRPHILLVSIDTLRVDRLGAYGGPRGLTPSLDRLAAQGVTFERAASPMPLTGPTHTTMLTGLEPGSHGVVRNGVRLRDDIETLGETLAAAGYRTGGFVSGWPLADVSSGLASHFQHYDEDLSLRSWVPHAATSVPLLWLVDRSVMFASFWRFNLGHSGPFVAEVFERDGARTVARALAWIARRPERPFFAFVHLYEPHTPYAAPPAFVRALDPGYVGPLDRFERRSSDPRLGELFADPAAMERIRRLYEAEVAYADSLVGRLLAGLEALDLAEDTVVVFTSDHGEGLGEHGECFDHSEYLYETTVRVPLLLRVPGDAARGGRVDELVTLADLAPTLLELAGVRPRRVLDGRSLVALLAGEPLDGDRLAYGSTGVRWLDAGAGGPRAFRHYVRTRRHKLVWTLDERWPYLGGPAYEELYDLEADADELHNLLPGDADPELVARLRGELRVRLASALAGDARVDPETARRLRSLGYL